MQIHEKNDIADAWIKVQQSSEMSPEYEENFWATEKIWRLASETPYDCLEVIMAIISKDGSDWILENVGAGPLEELLVKHGSTLIDVVEARARNDAVFCQALSATWQNEIPVDVWRRIQKVTSRS